MESVTQDSAAASVFDPQRREFRRGGIRNLPVAIFQMRLKKALDRLALRRSAVLPFLPRQHPLNRNLGKLRHHALQVLAAL